MPASIMRTSTSGSREAGPIVATILVRRIGRRTVAVARHGQCCGMSIETEEELEGLRRAGRVVAVVLRELAGRAAGRDPGSSGSRGVLRHGGRAEARLRRAVESSSGQRRAYGVPGAGGCAAATRKLEYRRARRLLRRACVRCRSGRCPRAPLVRAAEALARGLAAAWAARCAHSEAVARGAPRAASRCSRPRRPRDRAHDPRAAVGAEHAGPPIRRSCTRAS